MKIKIPATSANLGAGFDTLGLAIQLYNEVSITSSSIQSINIKGEGSDNAYIKRKNPFTNIFNETMLQLTGKTQNFRFEFTNNIPFARGLGSSSAVIVGAIASAYHMAGLKVDKEVILNKALLYENHPDNIAPAVHGGFNVCIVHGKKVFVQKKSLSDELSCVLSIPNQSISTSKSRTLLPKQYKINDIVTNISHSSFITAAFFNEDWDLLKNGVKDSIHEELRMKQMPILFEVRELALQNGALMSTLSGSGSTFFHLAYKKRAKRLVNILKTNFSDMKTLECEFDNEGFFIQKS